VDGKEHTNWIQVVAWSRLAEIAGEYLNKGEWVAIVGSLRQRAYEDCSGNKRTAVEVIVRNMKMLTSMNNNHTEDNFPSGSDSIPF